MKVVRALRGQWARPPTGEDPFPNDAPQLVAGTAVLLGLNIAGALLGFFASVLIGRGLGQAVLGSYALVMAWVASLGLFVELGLNTLLTRDLARDRSEGAGSFRATLLLKAIASLPWMAGLWFAAPVIGHSVSMTTAIRLASPLVLLAPLYGSITAVFRAFRRMGPILHITAGGLALQCGVTAVLLSRGGGLLSLILLAVVVQILQIVAGGIALRGFFARGAWPDGRYLRKMLRRTAPFAAAAALGAVELRLGTILLGYLKGVATVGQFSAASKLAEMLRLLPNAFFGALFPALAGLAADRAEPGRLETTFRATTLGLLALGAIGAAAVTAWARPLIAFTFGPEFATSAAVLRWMAWAVAVALPGTSFELYLYARGYEGFVNWTTGLGLLVMIGAGVPLMLRWGAEGGAGAMLLAEIAMIGPLWWKRRRLARIQT
jgi:O-antigen/teichoic acid export membrane protein